MLEFDHCPVAMTANTVLYPCPEFSAVKKLSAGY
jgi:hypothetical protein